MIIPLDKVYWLCCSEFVDSTLFTYFFAAEHMISPIPSHFIPVLSSLGGHATAFVTIRINDSGVYYSYYHNSCIILLEFIYLLSFESFLKSYLLRMQKLSLLLPSYCCLDLKSLSHL